MAARLSLFVGAILCGVGVPAAAAMPQVQPDSQYVPRDGAAARDVAEVRSAPGWTTGRRSLSTPPAPYVFHSEGMREVVPGRRYKAGPIRRFLFGSDYRRVWSAPIEVPVIDLRRTAGGLTPVERGGGLQTRSLHLKGADGHQYVLRSVDKQAARSIPEEFHNTLVSDIAQDQVSAVHPYGAFIIPTLAEAAGVLHTVPTLVIIPDDPLLGEFRSEYAGMLALFERKPDEDQSDAPNFGRSRNIVGTEKLLEEIQEDNDARVDEHAYARARLLDMLIGDWDRHDDQWRWAEFEGEHGTRYVAVPRDRDFAFAQFDGFLNRLARLARSATVRKLTNFTENISDVYGLNYQGAKLDLRLASSLSEADWVALAQEIQANVTDEVIERAVRQWPEPVYQEIGAYTIDALKQRREQLPEVAAVYYQKLAHTVDVLGSDQHERFEVTRLDDGRTQVVMYKTTEAGEVVRELYRRTFYRGETEEIRLYGLGGRDTFLAQGRAKRAIRVRAIGGDGEDVFVDESRVAESRKTLHFYDTTEGNTWVPGAETRLHRASDPAVNRYEMRRFEFNSASPIAYFSYSSYDGPFFGGGLRLERPGFRKVPYAAAHSFAANYAPLSRAYNVKYRGEIIRYWQGWDLDLNASALAAYNFRNFYGFGNETSEAARDRFRARLRWVTAMPALARQVSPVARLSVGPRFEYVSVDPLAGRSIGDPRTGFTPEQFEDKYFAGVAADFAVDTRDSLLYPRRGLRWATEASVNAGVRNTAMQYARLASQVSFYQPLPLPVPMTLALRVGGATNVGDFMFYQANTLGGEENLRGFAKTRFAGRSSVFTNAELRARLFDFNLYLMRGELGVIGFYDTGRVWADGEQSTRWHQGYGGGLWLAPFYRTVVTGTAGFSSDGPQFDVGIGFLF